MTTTTPGATDTPQSGSAYYWYLVNRTGQPIYGTWSAKMPASGDRSQVEASADHPWQPGDFAKATQYQDANLVTYWAGHICYNTHWWGYRLSGTFGDHFYGDNAPFFTLEADSTGALFVYPYGHGGYKHAMNPENGACM
ncbi:hypothetical protein [Rhodococcus jostii]|uniref:hypothetical protein n=1 Tax=Rhodococcus jostii TaxID=132919 RepID=UPI003651F3BC